MSYNNKSLKPLGGPFAEFLFERGVGGHEHFYGTEAKLF